MPEGDTIHKVARYMHPWLVNKRLLRVVVAAAAVPELTNRTVARVNAVGKHLLVHMAGFILRVHLGMHGSWHRYNHSEAWQRPRWQAGIALHTETDVFVCFSPEDVEVLRPEELARSKVAQLGPDLLAEPCDLAEVVRRAQAQPPQTPMIDILLNQHISCGLGNVYKNDILFIYRLHPLTPVGAISRVQLHDMFTTARRLLQSNMGGWSRTTTYDRRQKDMGPTVRRLYVYGHQRCPACHTHLCKQSLGKHRRNTFWCPTCQSENETIFCT